MKFGDLEISGFGIWSGLTLESLSPQLTVIYGPNEAGKTTILECLRGVLYGFTPARRDRYLPPVHGGAGCGGLGIRIDRQNYTVTRRDDGSRLLGGVTVTGPDGSTQGQSQLDDMLGGIDEAVYAHVFSVGLRELQELATLNDGEAAAWLYDLSTGLDGVSVSEVLGELRASRTRLLSPSGDKSQIIDLVAQREALRAEISELGTLNDRYWRLAGEREAAEEAVRAAEASQAATSAEIQRFDSALAVREPWRERALLEELLATKGRPDDFPADAVGRLRTILAGLRKARRRRARIKTRRRQLRTQRSQIQINESLWRQAARIAALSEHESWIAALDDQLRAANGKVAEHERRLAAAQEKLGLPDGAAVSGDALSSVASADLHGLARQLSKARKRLKAARGECESLGDERGARREEVARALGDRGEESLAAALEKQGQLVGQYRRRLQLDDRLDQLALHRQELEDKHHQLLDRQVLPLWLLIALAVVFVFGAGLVLAGLIIPWGAGTAIAGGLIAAAAAAGKFGIERGAARRLDATHKQLKMLVRQLEQAKAERDELDAQLPTAGGALASRLQAAEAELASLEELLSIDARRQAADEHAADAQERLKAAGGEWNRARRRWQQALGEAGLPTRLSPAHLRQLSAHGGSLVALERELAQSRDERDRWRREQAAVAARIEPLVAEAGWQTLPSGPAAAPLVEQLRRLRRELAAQEELVERRQKLDEQLNRLRRLASKNGRRAMRLVRRRRALFRAAGAFDAADFHRRAEQRVELDQLLHRRAELTQRIQAALHGDSTEEELTALLRWPAGQLEEQREEVLARRQQAADDIKRLAEQCGRIAAEQTLLAEDRRLPHKEIELSAVEERLAEAAARWQTLALTEHLIESVKDEYERERQPEVLQEASHYLERMTEGRYRRVWTPLGENALRVDDDQERSLPSELLSTGAREQLFLALRLALVTRYAREGKSLPLVLDDVLVNFDARRARAVAAMFLEFAAAGRQLILFTCHEHIAELFRGLDCDVRHLPSNANGEPKVLGPVAREHNVTIEPPRRRREKRVKELPPENGATVNGEAASDIASIEVLAAAPPSPVIVADAPPSTSGPAEADPAEMPHAVEPARRHRADPPHRLVPAVIPRRRRWSAEEFEGELEDQVNAAFESSAEGDAISRRNVRAD